MASIFDTLLSSQGSDAHRSRHRGGGSRGYRSGVCSLGRFRPGATTPSYLSRLVPVKSATAARPCVDRGRSGSHRGGAAPWCPTVVVVVSARGTGLLGAGSASHRLASVPPSRADVEDSRRRPAHAPNRSPRGAVRPVRRWGRPTPQRGCAGPVGAPRPARGARRRRRSGARRR